MTRSLRMLCGASLIALCLGQPALAEQIFTPATADFNGNIWFDAADGSELVLPGKEMEVGGWNFIPGQTVNLMRGTTVLTKDAVTVDEKGRFSWKGMLDADAAPGIQPVVAVAENPAAAVVGDVVVATEVPISGQDAYEMTSESVAPGPYQIARSADALFVTSAQGHAPVRDTALSRIDPKTLKTLTRATPADAPADPEAPAGQEPSRFAVYGVGVDEGDGHVWVTNSQQDTIAVYKADDLSLVKQFPPETVSHPRDVVIDAARGRAYVAPTGHGKVQVFDTKTLEELAPIVIDSKKFAKAFGVMSLALDEASGKLMTVSVETSELAVVDLATGKARVTPMPNTNWASGVAYDPKAGRIFVASQGTGNLLIINEADGKVIHDVYVGGGALNVAFDASTGLAWVVSRGAGTLTGVDAEGKIVANLELGGLPNFVTAKDGEILALTKALDDKPETGNRIIRVTKKP